MANKTTVAAKEAFRLAFEGIGGVPALVEWARDNPTEFFKLYSRLIPTDLTTDGKPIAATQTIVIGGRTIAF